MIESRSNRRADMLLGAGLVLVGMVAGGALFSSPGAAAFGAGEGSDDGSRITIPAIAMSGGDVALAKESDGHFVIINTSGWAVPVRVRDTELRSSPGESFVFAP